MPSPTAFDTVEVTSSKGRDLLAKLRTEGFVALIGSAISMWKPCDLPPGMEVTQAIADVLAATSLTDDVRDQIKGLITATAFEHATSACPKQEPLGENLMNLYRTGTPNHLHAAITRLLGGGVIEHVVTTNYDPCFEAAYAMAAPRRGALQTIVTEADVSTLDLCRPVLFKIHGCAARDEGRPAGADRSMAFSLAREGQLLPWKRRLLFRLLAGRNLLVCGYSGLDFEICPELPSLQANIFWNARCTPDGPDLTANARRVLMAGAGTVLLGDMREVVGVLDGSGFTVTDRAPFVGGLQSKLTRNLTPVDIDAWRVTLFSGIGCANEAIRIGEGMVARAATGTPAERVQALHGLGRGRFHAGQYRQAAHCYSEAAREAAAASPRGDLGIRLDRAEAERCEGYWGRAWGTITTVAEELAPSDKWLAAVVALRKALVLRYRYQSWRWFGPKARRIRREAKALLALVTDIAAEEGRWMELQQCELWAARFDIPFSEIYSGPMVPLPSREGYGQLGYYVAMSMATRDALRAGTTVPHIDELARIVEKLCAMGANAEAWKLAWVIRRKRGRSALTPKLRDQAWRAWKNCEYTLAMRLFLLINP